MSTCPAESPRVRDPGGTAASLERAADEYFQFIWRCLRRFGVWPEDAVDDAAQRVFEIAVTKRDRIVPGYERAFLFRTAALVAAEERRARRRSARECYDEQALLNARSATPEPHQAVEQVEWRARLDRVLENLPPDLRTVFVLFELESMPISEIADLLELPVGTVGSRLRRARSAFQEAARRLRAKLKFDGECA